MIINTKMTTLMQEVNRRKEKESGADLLLTLAWPKFVNNNGCILLSDQLAKSHASQENFQDETSFEAFVNHIHLNGTEFGEELKPVEIIPIAVKIAEMWQVKLSRDFSEGKFLIILTFDEEEFEVTLRFHKIRDSQIPWINLDGIEKYVEPIMAIEVGEEL